jgi:hypothetical protein
MWNNAMPWQKSDLTPNLGRIDSTADIRPGLGYDGPRAPQAALSSRAACSSPAKTRRSSPSTPALRPGVSVGARGDARVVGTILNTVFVARDNPVAYGYGAGVPVISANGMAFNVSNTLGARGGRTLMDPYAERPTGRGSVDDSDEPTGRKIAEAEPLVKQQPWEAKKLNEEEMRNNLSLIPASCAPK